MKGCLNLIWLKVLHVLSVIRLLNRFYTSSVHVQKPIICGDVMFPSSLGLHTAILGLWNEPMQDLTLINHVILMFKYSIYLNPILPGGGGRPSCFSSTILKWLKLKLSDFKDIPLRHILQVKPVLYILSGCHGNKITEGTSQDLAPKKSEKSVISEDIEQKFGIETKFGPLSSKTNISLQFDVVMMFLAFGPFS